MEYREQEFKVHSSQFTVTEREAVRRRAGETGKEKATLFTDH